MLLDSTNPVTARARFRSRSAVCFAGFIILSLGLVVVASWLLSVFYPSLMAMLAADVVVIAVSYFLYLLKRDQPVKLACGNCEAIILSNTPWVCGFCKQTNRNANDFPFVHQCGHCRDEAKAYRCHHCSELIFLTIDRDKNNYAHSVNAPSEVPKPDEHVEILQKLREDKERKEAELSLEKVDAMLLRMRKLVNPERPKKHSAGEVLKAEMAEESEWDVAEQEILAMIEKEHGDNPKLKSRLKKRLKRKILDRLADE